MKSKVRIGSSWMALCLLIACLAGCSLFPCGESAQAPPANEAAATAAAPAVVAAASQAAPEKLLAPNPPVRILIINTTPQIGMAAKAPRDLKTIEGQKLAALAVDDTTTFSVRNGRIAYEGASAGKGEANAIVLESPNGGEVLIRKVPYGVGWSWEGAEDRAYEGRIEIYPGKDGKLSVIVVLPLEEYLLGVVPSEIGSTSPHEALCAQAVAARSETVEALITRKYAGENYDICSDVECQAFSGNKKRSPESDAAVRATRGLAMFHEGKPMAAYYASSCGGYTEDIRNVWPPRADQKGYWDCARFDGEGALDFDLTREDDMARWIAASPKSWCNPEFGNIPKWAQKNFRWTREVAADVIGARLAGAGKDIGHVQAIRAVKRGPSGRMIQAEFIGDKGKAVIGPELAIRQVFDPPLRSAAFIVETQGGTAERPEKFIFKGAGWGHGVGMCQTGAIAMANAGKTFREILAHYYPNATLMAVYP